MTALLGEGLTNRLCQQRDLPEGLLTALAGTADTWGVILLTDRPDLTPTQSRLLYDTTPFYSDSDKSSAAAAHALALGITPALGEFIAELGQALGSANAQDARHWERVVRLALQDLSAVQIVHLSTGSNLTAAATLAAYGKLKSVDLQTVLLHLGTHLTPDAFGLQVRFTGYALGALRQDHKARGEIALLAMKCPGVFEDISLVRDGFTSAEANHIARLLLLPTLDDSPNNWASWLPLDIEAQGAQMDPTLLTEFAVHPQATPALLAAVASARLEQQDKMYATLVPHHWSRRPARALLNAMPPVPADQWPAILALLELLPKETTISDAVSVVTAVVS